MIFMLIIFRVHYLIDIVGGAVFACFSHQIVKDNLKIIDKIVNFPYEIASFLY